MCVYSSVLISPDALSSLSVVLSALSMLVSSPPLLSLLSLSSCFTASTLCSFLFVSSSCSSMMCSPSLLYSPLPVFLSLALPHPYCSIPPLCATVCLLLLTLLHPCMLCVASLSLSAILIWCSPWSPLLFISPPVFLYHSLRT